MAEAPAFPDPLEFLKNTLASISKTEMNIKKPLIDAGFPDIPMPAEFAVKLTEALPTLPAFPAGLPTLPFLIPPKKVEKVVPPVIVPPRAIKYG